MKKIAIIGTGIMGHGMAVNFLKAGHEVFVWNRSEEKLSDLKASGASQTTTPKEAAEKADIVFEVTANDESSRSVWTGEQGILAGSSTGKILIASATLSVTWIDELALECAHRKLDFFDMPLTGGRAGAESGGLIFLAGGDKLLLESVKPELAAVSKEVFYFGGAGSGTRFKLLLNALQAIHMLGFSEMISIAEKSGMDVTAVGDALSVRPGGTATQAAWRDYQNPPQQINFAVQWIAKDLAYARQFGGAADLPLLEDALKKFEELKRQGKGEHDWSVAARS